LQGIARCVVEKHAALGLCRLKELHAGIGCQSDHFAKCKNTLAKWSFVLSHVVPMSYFTAFDHFAKISGFESVGKVVRCELMRPQGRLQKVAPAADLIAQAVPH
jgi:hypothetical protein